jgi:hypothetical protein
MKKYGKKSLCMCGEEDSKCSFLSVYIGMCTINQIFLIDLGRGIDKGIWFKYLLSYD